MPPEMTLPEAMALADQDCPLPVLAGRAMRCMRDRIRALEAPQPPVVDEAVIRKALDECDVPLAYQSAIIAALTAALRGSGVQAGVTDEVVERACKAAVKAAQSGSWQGMGGAIRAALEAVWPVQAQRGEVAYWAAVADNGELVVAYPANDGNNGETARTECNQYINDALLNDRAAFRLVRLFTHAARPQQNETAFGGLSRKQVWWAGYRAGKGLPPDTPRTEAIAASPSTQQASVSADVVARVAAHIGLAIEYIEKQYPDATVLDRGPIMRNLRHWRDMLAATSNPKASVLDTSMRWRSIQDDPPTITGRYILKHRGNIAGHAYFTAKAGDTNMPVGWGQFPDFRPTHWLDENADAPKPEGE